jgi:hypothetical protein
MTKIEFAVYAPATPDLPYLAVVLSGREPLEAFGSQDREDAERILDKLRARFRGRQTSDWAPSRFRSNPDASAGEASVP